MTSEEQRALAIQLYNTTWDLIDKPDRTRDDDDEMLHRAHASRYLWAGVAAGVGLALALAIVMLGVASVLSDEGLEYFQLAMMLIAAGLIVQMVFWMRRHGRTFKKELEAGMQEKAAKANWWGLLAVVALAVGRESAETVVFLYGLSAEQQGALIVLPLEEFEPA